MSQREMPGHSDVTHLHRLHVKRNTTKPCFRILEKYRVMYNTNVVENSGTNELVGTVMYLNLDGFANVEWDDGSHQEELIRDLVRI